MMDEDATARLRRSASGLAVAALSLLLAGCLEDPPPPPQTPTLVRSATVELSDYAPHIELTGEIRAQIQSDLSFRVSGRVIERLAEVGDHVVPDQPLARLDAQEQEANQRAAEATVQAAEAQFRQATSNFERQKTLLQRGFTTRREYDQAEESFRTAQGTVDSSKAQLEAARDQSSYAVLRASAAGIITARNIETGQIMQAAQTAYTLAQDGGRDAVFSVQESLLSRERVDAAIDIRLIADPSVTTTGRVREVSPTVDAATGTVRVKVGLIETPPAMTLGAAIVGAARLRSRPLVVLPWTSLTADGDRPAVWVVDPQSKTVAVRPVTIEEYQTGAVVLSDGLKPGETVVTAGAQMLRPNQTVTLAPEAAR